MNEMRMMIGSKNNREALSLKEASGINIILSTIKIWVKYDGNSVKKYWNFVFKPNTGSEFQELHN